MCCDCWERYGREPPGPRARLVAELVKLLVPGGGNAHVVVDDWNVEDRHIEYCLAHTIPENAHELSDAQLRHEVTALIALKALPVEQRAAALAVVDGYVT